ncbi:hypothetical protein V4B73_31335, partial [Klebsiella pneumoniae]
TVNDFMDSVHHIWCPLSSQEYQDLPDGAETTLTLNEKDLPDRSRWQRQILHQHTRLAKAIATLEWATESCSVMRWR